MSFVSAVSHVAGRYCVDADAAACPFICERLRELRNAALARGVGGDALAAEERGHRGDVDDFAAAAREHGAARELREREYRAEVDVYYLLPFREREVLGECAVLHARAVYENVGSPSFAAALS